MNRLALVCIPAFAASLLSFCVGARAADTPRMNMDSVAPTTSSPSGAIAESEEIRLLKRQLEDSQRFQDQTLAAVYWSLGVVGGVALLLIGFGWFSNFRVYERDKAALERDLRVQSLEDVAKLREELMRSLTVSIEEGRKSQAASLQTSEKQIALQLEAKQQALASRLSEAVEDLKDAVGEISNDVRSLQLSAELARREDYLKMPIFRNALQASVTALDIAIKSDDEYKVGDVLDFVASDIREILKGKETPIDNYLVAQLVSILDSVKGEHAHAAAALKKHAPNLLAI